MSDEIAEHVTGKAEIVTFNMHNYSNIDILISTSLALIMLGIGLSLSTKDFKNILLYPKEVIIGLSAQMIFLPALAFLITSILNINNEFKVGIIILSTCPGGTTSNFITYLLNGKTGLSVSLTTLNSFITLISIPVIVNLALFIYTQQGTTISLPIANTIFQIFSITIIPATIGVLINTFMKKTATILNQLKEIKVKSKTIKINILKLITLSILGLVFLIKFLASEDKGGLHVSKIEFKQLLLIGLVFNIISLIFGYFLSKAFKLTKTTAMTIGIEVGLQNTTLAFLIAGTLLQNINMQKPAFVYAFFSFWTALAFGLIIKQSKVNNTLPNIKNEQRN